MEETGTCDMTLKCYLHWADKPDQIHPNLGDSWNDYLITCTDAARTEKITLNVPLKIHITALFCCQPKQRLIWWSVTNASNAWKHGAANNAPAYKIACWKPCLLRLLRTAERCRSYVGDGSVTHQNGSFAVFCWFGTEMGNKSGLGSGWGNLE